ncbi:MAG: protein kinase [Alphaproteobacteria bacterium]|nr:protein kinase [Alphaproteobacteria bacterium]
MGAGRRFNLIRELGSGAFGTVYLAEMESLGGFKKEVALKLLRPEVGDRSDAGRRLRDEARLLGRLRHRHIVQVDDLVRVDGRWAVVMEHVPGADLEAILQATHKAEEDVPPLAAVEIVRAMALALDSAYTGVTAQGEPLRVVHRDIKPSNVRLSEQGEIKVLDFGIARAEFEEREAKTGRVRYGSVGYMSPERLLGEPETAAGDVYALGVVLYELLLGETFGRVKLAPDQQQNQLRLAQARLRVKLGEGSAAEAAEPVVQLISETLAYDVGDRPTAADVAERLRELTRRIPGEDVHGFAARFVPRVAQLLGDESHPVDGTLSEEAFTTSQADAMATFIAQRGSSDEFAATDVRAPSLAALVDDGATTAISDGLIASGALEPERPEWDEPAPSGGRGVVAAIAVAVALLVALVGYALIKPAPSDTQPPGELVPPGPAMITAPPEPTPPPVEAPSDAPAVADAPPEDLPADPPVASPPAEAPPSETPTPSATSKVDPPKAPPPEDDGSAAPDTPPVNPDAPRLRAVKVTVNGASKVRARCGDRDASGASSALVRDLPAGTCVVTATIDGADYTASLMVDQPKGVTCAVEGDTLACR